MGLFDFIKNAGASIPEAKNSSDNAEKAKGIKALISMLGLEVKNLAVEFDGETATLSGTTSSHIVREKVILAAGNISGVARVNDNITVEADSGESVSEKGVNAEGDTRFYTVQRGDSLSKIAKEMYGDMMKYTVIFEANTPMLKDPNLIYPGQVLRIPPLS